MSNRVDLIDVQIAAVGDSKNGDLINAKHLQDKGYTGKGVTVAIIDTGCDKTHPMLKDKIIGGRNYTKEGTARDFTDNNGHGTHVAGIVAGEYDGVAKGCKLIILKVLNKRGEGDLQSVVKAIYYAIGKKVDIINMSLGCSNNDPELEKAVKKAVNKGICVCCASGNSGDNNPNTDENGYPGAYAEVISVGAMNSNLGVSTFSNSNRYVDVVAPGENITSTYPGGGLKSLTGTSMATPCVSGALALIIEWSTQEFKRRLTETEIFGLLIKNTTTLQGVDRRLQGQGRLDFKENQ